MDWLIIYIIKPCKINNLIWLNWVSPPVHWLTRWPHRNPRRSPRSITAILTKTYSSKTVLIFNNLWTRSTSRSWLRICKCKGVSVKTRFCPKKLSMVRKPNRTKGVERTVLPIYLLRRKEIRTRRVISCLAVKTLKTDMTRKTTATLKSTTTSIPSQMILGCHRNRKGRQLGNLLKLKRKSEVPIWAKERGGSSKTVKVLSNADWRNRTSS